MVGSACDAGAHKLSEGYWSRSAERRHSHHRYDLATIGLPIDDRMAQTPSNRRRQGVSSAGLTQCNQLHGALSVGPHAPPVPPSSKLGGTGGAPPTDRNLLRNQRRAAQRRVARNARTAPTVPSQDRALTRLQPPPNPSKPPPPAQDRQPAAADPEDLGSRRAKRWLPDALSRIA